MIKYSISLLGSVTFEHCPPRVWYAWISASRFLDVCRPQRAMCRCELILRSTKRLVCSPRCSMPVGWSRWFLLSVYKRIQIVGLSYSACVTIGTGSVHVVHFSTTNPQQKLHLLHFSVRSHKTKTMGCPFRMSYRGVPFSGTTNKQRLLFWPSMYCIDLHLNNYHVILGHV